MRGFGQEVQSLSPVLLRLLLLPSNLATTRSLGAFQSESPFSSFFLFQSYSKLSTHIIFCQACSVFFEQYSRSQSSAFTIGWLPNLVHIIIAIRRDIW